MRCLLLLAVLALSACPPPPPDPGEPFAGCACTQLDVTLATDEDMTYGYPAVNDAVRKPCSQRDGRTVSCALDNDTLAQCEERAARALEALEEQGIEAETSCFDACGCDLI
jgi:hypothetical protein